VHVRWFRFLVLCSILLPVNGVAQRALRIEPGALATQLEVFRAHSGWNIIFARSVVDGLSTSCQYQGSNYDEALQCILQDTGIGWRKTRDRQVVLLPPTRTGPTMRASSPPTRASLGGRVVDARTGEILPGTHVFLPGWRVGTVTNAAGFFLLPEVESGPLRVRITHIGYEPVDTLLVTPQSRATIRLRPVAVVTRPLVVERGREEAAYGPGSLNLPLTRMAAMPTVFGERDALQALTWLPGVMRSGEASGGLVVRGGEPDENLYILDGAPVFHPWHAFTLVSTFHPETFKSVTLHRGPLPAELGGRLSSVMEAELKDGNRERPTAHVGLSALSGQYVIESPLFENSSFMIAGRRSYIDQLIGRRHPVEQNGIRDTLRTGYVFSDLTAKLTFRPGYRHRVSISVYEGRDDLDVRLPFDLSLDFTSWRRPASLFFEIDHGWSNRVRSVRYQFLPGTSYFGSVTVYSSTYKARENARLQPSEALLVESSYGLHVQERGMRTDFTLLPVRGVHVVTGAHVARRTFSSALEVDASRLGVRDPESNQRVDMADWEGALFTQSRWIPAPYVTLQGGLRAEVVAKRLFVLPNVSMRYDLVPDVLTLRTGVGMQVQSLHRLRDQYALLYDLVSARWVPAGGDVPVAVARQMAAGVDWHIGDTFRGSLEGYSRWFRNVLVPADEFQSKDALIGPGIDLGALLGQYQRAKGVARGLELTLEGQLGAWGVWAAGALESSIRETATDRYPSDFSVPWSVQWVARRASRTLTLTAGMEWRAGLPYAAPAGRYSLGDPLDPKGVRYVYRPEINNARLPAYFRADAGIQVPFRLGAQPWTAALHLYNVTNRRNVSAWSWDPSGDELQRRSRRSWPILPLFELWTSF